MCAVLSLAILVSSASIAHANVSCAIIDHFLSIVAIDHPNVSLLPLAMLWCPMLLWTTLYQLLPLATLMCHVLPHVMQICPVLPFGVLESFDFICYVVDCLSGVLPWAALG